MYIRKFNGLYNIKHIWHIFRLNSISFTIKPCLGENMENIFFQLTLNFYFEFIIKHNVCDI